MLRFGIITNVDEKTAKARVQFAEDDMLSYWLSVLQQKTHEDKFYCLPDIGEQVACLMDVNSEEGVILGSLYSEADIVPVFSRDKFNMTFEDGTTLEYDRKEHILLAKVKGSIGVQADEFMAINSPSITIIGDIFHNGALTNTNGITSNSEISDHTSSMQAMRDIYDSHKHTGNQGSPTSPPKEVMS